jgi:hypothetical protein
MPKRKSSSEQTELFDVSQLASFPEPAPTEPEKEVPPEIRRLQYTVLQYFHSIHPSAITDWELEEHFKDHGATYRTRRNELVKMSLLMPKGFKIVQGARRDAYAITMRGIAWLEMWLRGKVID